MRIYAAVTLLLVCSQMAYGEVQKSFLTQLSESSLACRVNSSAQASSAFEVGRKNGTNSKSYNLALESAYQKSKACADDSKRWMKSRVRAEVTAHPAMRDAILDAYAKWIDYMDWLGSPRDFDEKSQEKPAFEQAANRLQAEMDIQ